MKRDDRNPLRETGGKGDKDRSCYNPKFRKKWDKIFKKKKKK